MILFSARLEFRMLHDLGEFASKLVVSDDANVGGIERESILDHLGGIVVVNVESLVGKGRGIRVCPTSASIDLH